MITEREKSLFWPSISIFLPVLVLLLAGLMGHCKLVHAAENIRGVSYKGELYLNARDLGETFVEWGMNPLGELLISYAEEKKQPSFLELLKSLFIKEAEAAERYATYYTGASTKAEGRSGVWTASGERYNEKAMTCAMRRRDFGKEYAVYGQETGRTAFVKQNDFGPGRGPQKKGVIVDLSPAAFKEVCGDLKQGKCQVSVQEVL